MIWLRLSKSTLEMVFPSSCGTCDSASHGRSTTRSKNTSNTILVCVIFVFASYHIDEDLVGLGIPAPRGRTRHRFRRGMMMTACLNTSPKHETAATATVEAAGLFHVPLRHNVGQLLCYLQVWRQVVYQLRDTGALD